MMTTLKVAPRTRFLFEHLNDYLDVFLQAWAERMGNAGYMSFTTAKRADCTLSLHYFSSTILSLLTGNNELPCFDDLVKKNTWAKELMAMSGRHRARGITLGMFMGCFKTFIHSIEFVIKQSNHALEHKNEAIFVIRHVADAFETILLEESVLVNEQETVKILDEKNRALSLEKCKYENILSSISDLVFLIDQQGKILEANQSAIRYFQENEFSEHYIWEYLPLTSSDLQALISGYNGKHNQALADYTHKSYFDVTLVPLSDVSLASKAYLLIFTDVSAHAQQKSILEHLVAKRTAALAREKVQLEEMNITLKTVLNSIEREKNDATELRTKILKEQVFPILRKLKTEQPKDSRDIYLQTLEKKLISLFTESSEDDDFLLPSELTAVEIKICRMLREGLTSKNIAQALNVSVETIYTHRKNIRSKLGLQGKKTSLFNSLNSTDLI